MQLIKEISFKKENYMYTAVLANGDVIIAFEDGTGRSDKGEKYKIVWQAKENDEAEILGWVKS